MPDHSARAVPGGRHGDRVPREPGHRRRRTSPRLPGIAVVIAALVAGLLAGRAGHPAGAAAAGQPAAAQLAAPAAALSSSWYCAGATDRHGGVAPGTLVVSSAAARSLQARVTVTGSDGRRSTTVLTVPARSSVTTAEAVPGGSPWVAAEVDLDGGDAAVAQRVHSSVGWVDTPCVSTGSGAWYFASGQTLVNADPTLTLYNPFAAPAIVDLGFSTDQGVEQPTADQGIDVAPGAVVAVDLRDHLRRRSFIATTVTATAGRVVAWQTQVVTSSSGHPLLGTKAAAAPAADPASPDEGITVTPGAPAAATSWSWADGVTGPGLDERVEVYNPGAHPATVHLAVHLDQGAAEPFTLAVGPQSVATVDLSGAARVPPGVGWSATLTSTGAPVVAQLASASTAPQPARGDSVLPGATAAARTWLISPSPGGSAGTETLTVRDAGPAATVMVEALDGGPARPLPGLTPLHVAAGGRLTIPLSHWYTHAVPALVVTASAPAVVSTRWSGRGTGGTAAPGAPLAG